MDSLERLRQLTQLLITLSEAAIYHKTNSEILGSCFKLFKPLVDELEGCGEPLMTVLQKIENFFFEAKELLQKCAGRGSKSLVVLQIHQVVEEFSAIALDLQLHLESLPLESQQANKQVEQCIDYLEKVAFCFGDFEEQLSEEIRAALKAFQEGRKESHELLVKLAEKLNLKSNLEILMEASYLEREKKTAIIKKNKREEELISALIDLFSWIADELALEKQTKFANGHVSIPPDFLCPLSLELMCDPVIVASGQTYERGFIQEWLDQGLVTCPKTRQDLAHLNLIPNYTVKGLITNWCEINDVPIPERGKVEAPTLQFTSFTKGKQEIMQPMINGPSSYNHFGAAGDGFLPSVCSVRTIRARGHEESIGEGNKVTTSEYLGLSDMSHHQSIFTGEPNFMNSTHCCHSRDASASSAGSSFDDATTTTAEDSVQHSCSIDYSSPSVSDVSEELDRSRVSSNIASVLRPVGGIDHHVSTSLRTASTTAEVEKEMMMTLSSSIRSTPSDGRNSIELKVEALVEDLQSSVEDAQRNAAVELRLLAKHNMQNRIVIANCGAIAPLVSLLQSNDLHIQENAVTALLNLSINYNNKSEIVAAGAIVPLVHVLNIGTSAAKENAAATLFSLSVMNENKRAIGESGAIAELVDLLINGTPRGKKDAATALFNLSILHENKIRIVRCNAVRPLVNLILDPAAGMVDKAVAVLANLATIHEGRLSIAEEEGIPALVEVIEFGSQRGKENAAVALLQLCTNSGKFKAKVLQEGAIPLLVALSNSGTARAKEKASALLRLFREQRHAIHGRGAGEAHVDRPF